MAKNEVEAVSCSKPKEIDEWEVQDALRTLTRAEEIKSDPKLMKLVEAKAKEQQAMLGKALGQKVEDTKKTQAEILYKKEK